MYKAYVAVPERKTPDNDPEDDIDHKGYCDCKLFSQAEVSKSITVAFAKQA